MGAAEDLKVMEDFRDELKNLKGTDGGSWDASKIEKLEEIESKLKYEAKRIMSERYIGRLKNEK